MAMKKVLLLISLSFFLNLTCIDLLIGQTKKNVSVRMESQKIGYSLFNNIVSTLSNSVQDYEFQNNTQNLVITVTPSVQKKGMKSIEGMESKKVGKALISLKIKNEALGLDSLIKSEYSISGKTENEIDAEILDKFNKDLQIYRRLSEVLDFMFKSSFSDCLKNLIKVDEMEASGKYKEAIGLLLKIENNFSACKSNFEIKKVSLIKLYEKEVCEKLLYDAKIYINSGVEFQMNKAVGLLLQIPPSAACKDEAIKLSEELSTKMNLTKANSEKLIQYQKIIIQNNNDSWYDMLYGGF